jgi:hypothetical protein
MQRVTTLWRGVRNTSTRCAACRWLRCRGAFFRRRGGRMRAREKMAAVRRGVTLRRKRVREDAAVRRGVTLRRRRVVRKVARIRKRVTRMCGMRCRKPCHDGA